MLFPSTGDSAGLTDGAALDGPLCRAGFLGGLKSAVALMGFRETPVTAGAGADGKAAPEDKHGRPEEAA